MVIILLSGQIIKSEQRVPDDDLYGDDSQESNGKKKAKDGPKADSAETEGPGVCFGLG